MKYEPLKIVNVEQNSRLYIAIASMVKHVVHERKGYQQARKRARARLRKGFDLCWTPPRSRDELHER